MVHLQKLWRYTVDDVENNSKQTTNLVTDVTQVWLARSPECRTARWLVLLATARQLATPAFATWRSPAGESEIQKRRGETWRSLSKLPRITEVYIQNFVELCGTENRRWYLTHPQAKVRKDTPNSLRKPVVVPYLDAPIRWSPSILISTLLTQTQSTQQWWKNDCHC